MAGGNMQKPELNQVSAYSLYANALNTFNFLIEMNS
jgi:hypothetical protein